MAHKEIEGHKQRLVDIKNMSHVGERNEAYIELGAKLGASGCGSNLLPAEREVEHIRGINQALQTATMIDMCAIAARNFWVAIIATIIALISALAAWSAIVKMVR